MSLDAWMQWRNTSTRYGAVAQFFHWAIVALILLQYVIGIDGAELQSGFEQLVVLARHKSFGITVFVLAIVRLGWRWFSPPPSLPPEMKPSERVLAHLSHGMLYALMFSLPVTGWLYSSASGVSVSWFGWVALPDLVRPSKPLAHTLLWWHVGLAITLALILVLHVFAAFWHHLARRDTVLVRMLPFTRWKNNAP